MKNDQGCEVQDFEFGGLARSWFSNHFQKFMSVSSVISLYDFTTKGIQNRF